MSKKSQLAKVGVWFVRTVTVVWYTACMLAAMSLLTCEYVSIQTKYWIVGYLVGVMASMFLTGYVLGRETDRLTADEDRCAIALCLIACALCWPLSLVVIVLDYLRKAD